MQKHILFINNLISHIMSVFTGLYAIVKKQFVENEWDFYIRSLTVALCYKINRYIIHYTPNAHPGNFVVKKGILYFLVDKNREKEMGNYSACPFCAWMHIML